MKHHSQLIEATLLKRPISFLMEVVLQSKKRIMLRCPNLGSLQGCDILGTQLWFSAPSNGHCLPTLELVEVNGGFLVGINPEILKDLFIDAITQGCIKELSDYQFLGKEPDCKLDDVQIFNLYNKTQGKSYVSLEHVINVNEQLEGIFPSNKQNVNSNLDYLVLKKQKGYRATLIFCILHSGAKNLKIIDKENSLYIEKMRYALQQGVEVLAYKAKISTQEIKLNNKLPIHLQVIAKL